MRKTKWAFKLWTEPFAARSLFSTEIYQEEVEWQNMMTSWHGNAFRIASPLWWDLLPLTKGHLCEASNCLLVSCTISGDAGDFRPWHACYATLMASEPQFIPRIIYTVYPVVFCFGGGITTAKQKTTQSCIYFIGHTLHIHEIRDGTLASNRATFYGPK